MNKRIKKKKTKQARAIINKENRLNKRVGQKVNRANQRAMSKLSHGIGTSSIEANVTKLFKGIGQAVKENKERTEIQELKEERMAFLSEKLSTLEARYDKKGNLTDNQWEQYERYSNELKYLLSNGKEWKAIDVSKEVGKKNYTEGQKNYIRALKFIEDTIGKAAADLKAVYGSDDIEELAQEYYIRDLDQYSEEELKEIEEEFNKTHGYQVKIKKAVNPFANIDFETLRPN